VGTKVNVRGIGKLRLQDAGSGAKSELPESN
jgi:hypothetical protein